MTRGLTQAIATGISFTAGAAGYLMFGKTVSDEVTKDLMRGKYHYPRALNIMALWMIVINPLTKFGLSSRPLNLTIEGILRISPSPQPFLFSSFNGGLESALESGTPETSQIGFPERRDRSSLSTHNNPRTSRRSSALTSPSNPHHFPESQSQIVAFEQHVSKERKKRWLRMVSRVVITALCVGVAVVLPGFGRVMAFLGSFSAFLICIILPLLFYIRLSPTLLPSCPLSPHSPISSPTAHSQPMSRWTSDRFTNTIHWVLVIASTALMIAGLYGRSCQEVGVMSWKRSSCILWGA